MVDYRSENLNLKAEAARQLLVQRDYMLDVLQKELDRTTADIVLLDARKTESLKIHQQERNQLSAECHRLRTQLATTELNLQNSNNVRENVTKTLEESNLYVVASTAQKYRLEQLLETVLIEDKYRWLRQNERLMEISFKRLQEYKRSMVDNHYQIEQYESGLKPLQLDLRTLEYKHDRLMASHQEYKSNLDRTEKEYQTASPFMDNSEVLENFRQTKERFSTLFENSKKDLAEAEEKIKHKITEVGLVEKRIQELKNQ